MPLSVILVTFHYIMSFSSLFKFYFKFAKFFDVYFSFVMSFIFKQPSHPHPHKLCEFDFFVDRTSCFKLLT